MPVEKTHVVNDDWLTDEELRSSAIPVIGPLTNAELRASAVAVYGPLTDDELRATPVPVDIDDSIVVNVEGPLTDDELRASPVPVSGPLTDTELRASSVSVDIDDENITSLKKVYITDVDTLDTAKVDVNQAQHIVDIRALDVFEQILTVLKKIEFHLSLASDTELKDNDV